MGISRGFSLIEMIIYATLSIFLVMLVLQFLSNFQRFALGRSGTALYVTSLNACIDSMSRDCASAPADTRLWISMQPDTIMWKCQQGVQGFAFDNDRLMRISRSVDGSGRLRAPAHSTLLNHVNGTFTITRSQDLVSIITITLNALYNNRVFSSNKQVYLHEGIVS
jgi:hypothetical protein